MSYPWKVVSDVLKEDAILLVIIVIKLFQSYFLRTIVVCFELLKQSDRKHVATSRRLNVYVIAQYNLSRK